MTDPAITINPRLAPGQVKAVYRVMLSGNPEVAADAIVREQSHGCSGSSVKLKWGEAAVFDIKRLRSHPARGWRRFGVTSSVRGHSQARRSEYVFEIIYSGDNLGGCVARLLNQIVGELTHLGYYDTIKLSAIEYSRELFYHWRGPLKGVTGIRSTLRIKTRPLLIAPVKPSVGIDVEFFGKLAYKALIGGADIVKDDELYVTSTAECKRRLKIMREVLDRASQKTGRPKMFVCNAFGSAHESRRTIEDIVRFSQFCILGVLICPFWSSFCALEDANDILSETNIPIVSHNSGFTTISRPPHFGIADPVIAGLQRLAGADIIIMPAPFGSFVSKRGDVAAGYHTVNAGDNLNTSLLGLSGKKNPGNIARTLEICKSPDVALVVGSYIYEHKGGPEEGARRCLAAIEKWSDGR